MPLDAPNVPDHELLRPIGRGSYGKVWLARNVVGSFRAVKIVYRASFDSDRPYEREFSGLQKFEPVSRTHPGLVNILHIGRSPDAGYFYSVMEVADDVTAGQTIEADAYVPRTLASEVAQQGRLPLSECVELGLALTEALGHLHSHGLVHRDIKPSNIIFVNSRPKLADIGLVTQIGAKATNVGTEGYLAPEGPGGPSADIYSLGKVLYEISMGKEQDQFPELPTRLRELPDAAELMRFNALILKACDGQPSKRWRSAEGLRDALAELRQPRATTYQVISQVQNNLAGGNARPPGGWQGGTGLAGGSRVVILSSETPRDVSLRHLLAERLARDGFSIPLDDQPVLGLKWARRIEHQIRGADAVVVLLSPTSVGNDLIAYGLELVHQASRRHTRLPRLAPVLLDLTMPLPRRLAAALEGASPIPINSSSEPERVVEAVRAALSPIAN